MNTLITLDIDGTICDDTHVLNEGCKFFLEGLHQKGYVLAFITGRSFSWGNQVLHPLSIPYFLAIHNGAIILKMPEKKLISKKLLNSSVFSVLENICQDEPSDFVVYAGYEGNDITYYRPHLFDKNLLSYLEDRRMAFKEKWLPIEGYESLPVDSFASVKCFGDRESAKRISSRIERELNLHAPAIKDPFNREFYVVQATNPEVDKGKALETIHSLLGKDLFTIAAGDDINDISMLERADVAIAMATSPKEVLSIADIIAAPAIENGIINGIIEALEILSEKGRK